MEKEKIAAIFTFAASIASALCTLWPLVFATAPFRIGSRKPTLTNYLNLICLSLVFLLFVSGIVVEYFIFFVYQIYQEKPNLPEEQQWLTFASGYLKILLEICSFMFVLVVLDRYRIFREMINYPGWILPFLVVLSALVFLGSLTCLLLLFFMVDELDALQGAVFLFMLIYGSVIDTVATAHIAVACLRRLTRRSGKWLRSLWAIIILLLLMVFFDACAFVTMFEPLSPTTFFAGMMLIPQFLTSVFFGFHILIGLLVLMRLKAAVTEDGGVIEEIKSEA